MRQIYLEHINLFMLSVIIGETIRIFIGTDEEIKENSKFKNIKREVKNELF